MATVQDKPRQAPGSKYDALVEERLERARARIRGLDAAVAALGFVAGTLAYGLGMVVLDSWVQFSSLARQLCFGGYLLAAGLYLTFALILPLLRRLNPYYAARRLEQATPGAKNSVVNWLDLREQQLPGAIRGAVSQRAARDAARADLERAISGRRAAWMGGVTTALFLAVFVTLLLYGAYPFASLLKRTFAPFVETTVATRTGIKIVRPEGGDATVTIGQSVTVAAELTGWVPPVNRPDSPRLLFRYQQTEPFETVPLKLEADRQWAAMVLGDRVQNGFWYKVAAGDAETREYRVNARSTPLVEKYDVQYHYRPYLHYTDDTSHDPNLKALEGTDVTLVAHTNRTVQDANGKVKGKLDLKVGEIPGAILAEPVPDDPKAMQFKLTLKENGAYRVRFTSAEGESNSEHTPYNVVVIRDDAPQVELTKPGQEVTLPANGVLPLEGRASDDVGVKSLTLRLKTGTTTLEPKPYRDDKALRLADGGYPKALAYKDFVELDKVKDADGKPLALQPGMEVEYWLEAADDFDFPAPHVSASQHYKVKIDKPDPDQKKEEQARQQARDEQKKHEEKQDQDLKNESKERKDKQNAPQNQDGKDPKQGEKTQPKDQDPKKGEGDKGEQGKDGQGEKEKQDKAKELAEKLKNQEKANGKGDPEQKNPGQKKEDNQDKPDKGDAKGNQGGEGQQDQPKPQDAGEKKGNGQQNPNDKPPNAGQQKGEGQKQPQDQHDKAGAKGQGQSQPDAQTGAGKDEGKPEQQPEPSQEKGPGAPGAQGDEQKQQGFSKPDDPEELRRENNGQGKQEGPNSDKQPKGDPKDDPKTLSRGKDKDEGKPDQGNKQGSKGGAKQGGQKDGEQNQAGGAKPSGDDKQDQAQAKNDQKRNDKGDGGKGEDDAKPEDAKKDDVARLSKKSRSDDAKEREKAREKLDEMSKKAKDQDVREAAKEAKEEADKDQLRREQDSKPSQAKDQPRDEKGQPQTKDGEGAAQGKGEKPDEHKQAGEGSAKGAGDKGEKAASKDGGDGGKPMGEPMKPDGDKSTAQGAGKGKGEPEQKGGRDGGNGPGGPEEGTRAQGEDPADHDADPNHKKNAGDLTLDPEAMKKLIEEAKKDPKRLDQILNDLHMTKKQFREVEEYVNEKLPKPGQRTNTGPTTGVRELDKGKTTDDVYKLNQGDAPPEFRPAFRKFTQDEPKK
jgi:collagen type III alpha